MKANWYASESHFDDESAANRDDYTYFFNLCGPIVNIPQAVSTKISYFGGDVGVLQVSMLKSRKFGLRRVVLNPAVGRSFLHLCSSYDFCSWQRVEKDGEDDDAILNTDDDSDDHPGYSTDGFVLARSRNGPGLYRLMGKQLPATVGVTFGF